MQRHQLSARNRTNNRCLENNLAVDAEMGIPHVTWQDPTTAAHPIPLLFANFVVLGSNSAGFRKMTSPSHLENQNCCHQMMDAQELEEMVLLQVEPKSP